MQNFGCSLSYVHGRIWENKKLFCGTLGPLLIGLASDPWKRTPPHKCYRVEFGRSKSNRMGVGGGKKASSLDIAPLTILNSGTLQPRKWRLTGNDCSTAAHAVAAQNLRLRAIWPTVAASRHTTPQSTTLGLHPVIHVPNYMDHYSFTDPWAEGWMAELAMLADR